MHSHDFCVGLPLLQLYIYVHIYIELLSACTRSACFMVLTVAAYLAKRDIQ